MTVLQDRLDDLYRTEGKAELIGRRIVRFMPSGLLPTAVAAEIYSSLRLYVKSSGHGVALPNGIGYAVPELTSGREFAARLREVSSASNRCRKCTAWCVGTCAPLG